MAGGLMAGLALGLGRMAAGGHFLSDVVWSAILALGIAHALYYHVLRIPRVEAGQFLAFGAPHVAPRLNRMLAIAAPVAIA